MVKFKEGIGKVSIKSKNSYSFCLTFVCSAEKENEQNCREKMYLKKVNRVQTQIWQSDITSNTVRQRKTKIFKYLSSLKTKAVTQNTLTKKILIP